MTSGSRSPLLCQQDKESPEHLTRLKAAMAVAVDWQQRRLQGIPASERFDVVSYRLRKLHLRVLRRVEQDKWLRQNSGRRVGLELLAGGGVRLVARHAHVELKVVVRAEVKAALVVEGLADLGQRIRYLVDVVPEELDDP